MVAYQYSKWRSLCVLKQICIMPQSHPTTGPERFLNNHTNRIAWQWADTLVGIRETLADIRRTTKLGSRWHFSKHHRVTTEKVPVQLDGCAQGPVCTSKRTSWIIACIIIFMLLYHFFSIFIIIFIINFIFRFASPHNIRIGLFLVYIHTQ